MKFSIKSTQRNPRSLSFRLVVASLPGALARSTTGCPEGYAQCTVAKTATGTFALNFVVPFKRAPQITITPLHATLSLKPVLLTRTTTGFTWVIRNDAAAATDPTEMDIVVSGFDSADQLGA